MRSLLLPYPSLFSSFISSYSKLLSISMLTLSYLKTKVHRSKPIDETVLVLEALLGHVQSFLHCHCECHAECYDKANQYEYDIYEIDMVRWTSWGANESQLLKVNKSIIDKRQKNRTEDKEAKINDKSCNTFYELIWHLKSEGWSENRAYKSCKYGVALEYNTKLSLWFVALLIWFVFKHLL